MRSLGLVAALFVGAAVLAPIHCASPTAMNVAVYSEVGCSVGATVALVGGTSLAELALNGTSSTSTECTLTDGGEAQMGNVILVPVASHNQNIAFAIMTRPDGQPPDACLDPAEASGCIVAKRELSFVPRSELAVRVDLRLSCLGVDCPTDQTCVKGVCVDATVTNCDPSCDEGTLVTEGDAGGGSEDGGREAGPCVAVAPSTAQVVPQGCLVTLAAGQGMPDDLVVNATDVFWTDSHAGTVMRVPLNGGVPTTVASGFLDPLNIAIDGFNAYFSNSNGAIVRVGLDGGTATTLATGNGPLGIAIDTTAVYWVDLGGGQVEKVPLDGGAQAAIAPANRPCDLVVDPSSVYWTNASGDGGPTTGTVMSVGHDGGMPQTLVSGLNSPESIASDAFNLYWVDVGDGTVVKVSKAGGAIPVTLATGQSAPGGIAVDTTNVYWTLFGDAGAIMKVGLDGGTPVTLSSGQGNPNYVVVDGTSVYWTDLTAGTISKLTPK